MNRTFALAMIAGGLGGLVARYTPMPSVFAQDKTPVTKEVRAQSFVLVDPFDKALGTFSVEPVPGQPPGAPANRSMQVVLRDSTDRVIWTAGGTGLRPLTTQLYSK